MAPDRDGVIVVKHADNGMPACRAGVFRSPVTDCTNTPTKEHFGLGTPEHEAGNRRAYQAGLDASATEKMAEADPPSGAPSGPSPRRGPGTQVAANSAGSRSTRRRP